MWHILCAFLTSFCHLTCTINNLKQFKQIVRAGGQNVDERDISNSGTVTKKRSHQSLATRRRGSLSSCLYLCHGAHQEVAHSSSSNWEEGNLYQVSLQFQVAWGTWGILSRRMATCGCAWNQQWQCPCAALQLHWWEYPKYTTSSAAYDSEQKLLLWTTYSTFVFWMNK